MATMDIKRCIGVRVTSTELTKLIQELYISGIQALTANNINNTKARLGTEVCHGVFIF